MTYEQRSWKQTKVKPLAQCAVFRGAVLYQVRVQIVVLIGKVEADPHSVDLQPIHHDVIHLGENKSLCNRERPTLL